MKPARCECCGALLLEQDPADANAELVLNREVQLAARRLMPLSPRVAGIMGRTCAGLRVDKHLGKARFLTTKDGDVKTPRGKNYVLVDQAAEFFLAKGRANIAASLIAEFERYAIAVSVRGGHGT